MPGARTYFYDKLGVTIKPDVRSVTGASHHKSNLAYVGNTLPQTRTYAAYEQPVDHRIFQQILPNFSMVHTWLNPPSEFVSMAVWNGASSS